MNEQENRDRLARAVKAARLRKFKTVDRARIAAGVSRGTWDNVERGDSVKAFSLAAIEEALEWPEGRALAILAGDDIGPGVVEDDGPSRLAELIAERSPNLADDVLAAIIGVDEAMVARWRTHRHNPLPPAEALRRLAAFLKVEERETFYAAGVMARYIQEVEPDEPSSNTA